MLAAIDAKSQSAFAPDVIAGAEAVYAATIEKRTLDQWCLLGDELDAESGIVTSSASLVALQNTGDRNAESGSNFEDVVEQFIRSNGLVRFRNFFQVAGEMLPLRHFATA